MRQEQQLLIEELLKTHSIAALIKTEQQKWDACLIKTGPSTYVMDEYELPKQIKGVQQPTWIYKRREFLKTLSVEERNSILTGDPAFAFDPVPYQVGYSYSYADAVRQAPASRAPPPAILIAPAPVQAPAPVPTLAPAQAIPIVPAPAQVPQQVAPVQIQAPAPIAVPVAIKIAPTPAPAPSPAPQLQPKPEPVPTPDSPQPGPSKPHPLANRPSFATLNKIRQQGFGSEDLAKAEAFKRNLIQKERLAELHAKEIQQLS